MADNYLERKMEEHRNGGSRPRAHQPGRLPAGMAAVPFPARRVLVAEGAATLADVARAFVDAGCRVAVTGTAADAANPLVSGGSVRFFPLENTDFDAVVANITKAWLDIDVVVVPAPLAKAIAPSLCRFRNSCPLLNPYGGRLIVIGADSLTDVCRTMTGTGFTVTGVANADALPETAIWLAQRSGSRLDGLII